LKDAIREEDAQKNRLLGALIPQAQKAVDAAVEQGASWQTLMQGNDQYETDRKQLNTLDAHLRALTGEADELRKALDDLDGVNGQEGTLRKLDRARADAERTERETRVKRDRYAEWAPNRLHREAGGVPDKSSREAGGLPENNEQRDGTQAGSGESALSLLDGNCETLEGQLSELENTFGMEQKQLQHRLDELKQDAARQEKIWRKLPEAIRLKEDLPVWDESAEDRLEAEVNEAKAELEREKQTLQTAQMQEIKMTERLNAAREKLVGAGF
jgi:prefoldin subunit 5